MMRRNTSAERRSSNNNVKNSQARSSRPNSVAVANIGSANPNSNSDSVLQRWMGRSVSAPCLPNRQLLSINGKSNKASILRLQCRPSSFVQPNYREMIRKRKAFAQRSKSYSASAVKCSELPNGESLHAFITGARYNRAHHLDSRSLKCFGLYIPRGNASQSFVNTSDSSSTIHGTNVKATHNMSDSHFMQPVAAKQGTGGRNLKPVPQCQSESESGSMTSLDREVNIVFGPSHSSNSSDYEDEMLPSVPNKEVTPGDDKMRKDNVKSSEETQESLTTLAPVNEAVEDREHAVNVVNSTHLEEKQVKDGGNKVDLTAKGKDDQEHETHRDHLGAKQVQESELDFISLEALKLTADILQQSSSSVVSTADTAKTDGTVKDTVNESKPKKRRDTPAPNVTSKPIHHSFQIQPTLSIDEAEETEEHITEFGGNKENVDSDLASKSSTIFVDMSNLMVAAATDRDCDSSNAPEDVMETQLDS